MFLQIPEVESLVPGIRVECELIPENIAVEGHEHRLIDEHLRVWVRHDGSNPFCDAEECCWGLVVVAASSEATPSITVDDEHPCSFHCLPCGVKITKAVISEAIYCDQLGIWLLLETSDESGDEDFGVILVPYSQAN